MSGVYGSEAAHVPALASSTATSAGEVHRVAPVRIVRRASGAAPRITITSSSRVEVAVKRPAIPT